MYRNRGMLFLLTAQFFATTMSLMARLLSTGPQKFHALQILFARQSITAAGCFLWMWANAVPDAPLGARGVRGLLVVRGLGGFWGIFGLYYSLSYLDISDATAITFLAPIAVGWACSVVPSLREPFEAREYAAGVVSLCGVALIARPGFLFAADGASAQGGGVVVTPHQRLVAVLVGLVGVLGAATAYTTIRCIGTRAHPLISVNYFASWCALVSGACLAFLPQVGGVIWPRGAQAWLLLTGIGLSGFVMQFCLTSGLQLVKGGRGASMVYLQMLFALVWERIVWGTSPGWMSIAGSTLILGSALWVTLMKSSNKKKVVDLEEVDESEEESLLAGRQDGGASFEETRA